MQPTKRDQTLQQGVNKSVQERLSTNEILFGTQFAKEQWKMLNLKVPPSERC